MATESASSANGNKASSANVIDQTGTESSNSTSADVSNQVRKRKGKTPIQAYTLPYLPDRQDPRPEHIITTKYGGKALRDSDLVQIADSLAKAETTLFKFYVRALNSIASGQVNKGDPEGQEDARRTLVEIFAIFKQFESIRSGDDEFVETYLSDQRILKLYNNAAIIIPQLIEYMDPINEAEYSDTIRKDTYKLADQIDQLLPSIKYAAAEGAIDSDTTTALRRKWQVYEDVLNPAFIAWNESRTIQSWREIMANLPTRAVRPAMPSRAATPSPSPTAVTMSASPQGAPNVVSGPNAPNVSSQAGSAIMTSLNGKSMSTNRFSIILWLTVIPTTFFNIATFALAYHYSPSQDGVPLPGTTQDSDFWLMLQNSIMQWFVLIITSIALWKGASPSMWWWLGPTVTALIASALAIPLYLTVSTAWSAFTTTIASVLQAFVTVQLAATYY